MSKMIISSNVIKEDIYIGEHNTRKQVCYRDKNKDFKWWDEVLTQHGKKNTQFWANGSMWRSVEDGHLRKEEFAYLVDTFNIDLVMLEYVKFNRLLETTLELLKKYTSVRIEEI